MIKVYLTPFRLFFNEHDYGMKGTRKLFHFERDYEKVKNKILHSQKIIPFNLKSPKIDIRDLF